MIKLIQGFDVSSPLPIDGRIILSRNEMANINDDIMPDKYFCICEEDGLLYLYDKNAEAGDNGKFYKAVPEKTSEIENDGNGTLNAHGNKDPFDTVESVDTKVADLESRISHDFIDNEELAANLRGYGLTQETSEGVIGTPIGSKVGITFDRETYEFSVNLIDYDNNTISSSATINLPIENLVVDVRYEELPEPDPEGHTKFIVITYDTENSESTETWVPVDAIVEGLVNETTFNAHVNDTVAHTNATEKAAWDAKYDLPEDGIPYEDMSAGVKESLDLADTALQAGDDISELNNDIHYVLPSDLIDGNNVTIDETSEGIVISAKDTTYEAGRGIRISTGSQGNDDSSSDTLYISATAANPTWTDIDTTSEVGPRDNEALNEIITELEETKQDKIQAGALLNADLVDDTTSNHKFVTSSDKETWNAKQDALQAGTNISLANDTVSVTGLSEVATSGSYANLSNKPQINGLTLSGNIQSSSLGLSYNDLSNRPTIGNRTLTINVADAIPAAASTTFTANQSQDDSSITVNVPFRTSQIQNTGHGRVDEDASEESYYGYVDSYEMDQAIASEIEDHDRSNSAHSDIRNTISSNNTAVTGRLDAIEGKIPSDASSSNQLADKDFVNSSIATNTATFRGTYESDTDLPTTTEIPDLKNNDYAFVIVESSEGNPEYSRFKYSSGSWAYEYTLNNSSFTAEQWAAITSGISAGLIPSTASSTNKLATASDVATKQNTLVSGTNIKSVNNNSLLGSGNLSVGTITSAKINASSPILIDSSDQVTSGAFTRTISHAATTATGTTFGPSTNQQPAAGSTFNVPYIVIDQTGHVTSGSATKTVTIPAEVPASPGDGLVRYSTGYAIRRALWQSDGEHRLCLSADGWTQVSTTSAGVLGWTQTVSVPGVSDSSMPIIDVYTGYSTEITSSGGGIVNLLAAWGLIFRAVCGDGTITFYAIDNPGNYYSVAPIYFTVLGC